MVEQHTVDSGSDERFRQDIRNASASRDGVHVRREDADALRRLRNAANLQQRGRKQDVHVILLRGFVRSSRERNKIVSKEVGLWYDIEERRLEAKSV